MPVDHLFTMIVYSLLVSVFFAFLRHREPRLRWSYGIRCFLWMVGGVLALGYLMLWTAG